MDKQQDNILVTILDILAKPEEEKKEVVKIFNTLCRNRVLKTLEENSSEDLGKYFEEHSSQQEILNKVKKLSTQEKVKTAIVSDMLDFFRDFLQEVIKDADKEQAKRISEYLGKVNKHLSK